jgi:isopropylmalate/homocitrate/citramalate synthase
MEQQMEFNFESSIPGYHVYKSIWTYEISEKLRCDREENNPNDKFAVKLVRNDGNKEPEAVKTLYRSPGNKKKQLVLCKNYVLQW